MYKVFSALGEEDLESILNDLGLRGFELANVMVKHDNYIKQDVFVVIAKKKSKVVY